LKGWEAPAILNALEGACDGGGVAGGALPLLPSIDLFALGFCGMKIYPLAGLVGLVAKDKK
jgi:hypothetical protein